MLIDAVKKLMGNDFYQSSVYDFGCNDGMKSLYFKQMGAKEVTGFEYREDCIKRANFINDIGNFGCKFVHHPVSADSPKYVDNLKPVDIVASFGILHHLVDHKLHIENLKKVTKKILVMHTAFSTKEIYLKEDNINNSFKSITGERKLTSKLKIFDMLYEAGFSYVLDIRDHKSIDENGFSSYLTYLIAII
jgi:2-polyprenyl-3-methyl-5-hydroxy-6-metoxy-1,4-benzoquinol methylase